MHSFLPLILNLMEGKKIHWQIIYIKWSCTFLKVQFSQEVSPDRASQGIISFLFYRFFWCLTGLKVLMMLLWQSVFCETFNYYSLQFHETVYIITFKLNSPLKNFFGIIQRFRGYWLIFWIYWLYIYLNIYIFIFFSSQFLISFVSTWRKILEFFN